MNCACRLYLAPLVVAILTLPMVDTALAQRRRGPEPPQDPQRTAADISGQFVGLEGDVIQLVDAEQNAFLAKFNPERTSMLISGEADVSFLRPGIFVRFTSPLDEKGNGPQDEELEELTLVTPGPTSYPGVTTEDAGSPTGPYDVIGQIKSLRKGKLVVIAQDAQVTVKLAEEPKITVKVTDPSWATPGDPIKVKGRFVGQGQVLCDLVEIKLREPLTGERKKKKKPSRSREKADPTADEGATEDPPADEPAPRDRAKGKGS